jgi:hypothetical protein
MTDTTDDFAALARAFTDSHAERPLTCSGSDELAGFDQQRSARRCPTTGDGSSSTATVRGGRCSSAPAVKRS